MEGSPGLGWVDLFRDQRSECLHSGHCHIGLLCRIVDCVAQKDRLVNAAELFQSNRKVRISTATRTSQSAGPNRIPSLRQNEGSEGQGCERIGPRLTTDRVY